MILKAYDSSPISRAETVFCCPDKLRDGPCYRNEKQHIKKSLKKGRINAKTLSAVESVMITNYILFTKSLSYNSSQGLKSIIINLLTPIKLGKTGPMGSMAWKSIYNYSTGISGFLWIV